MKVREFALHGRSPSTGGARTDDWCDCCNDPHSGALLLTYDNFDIFLLSCSADIDVDLLLPVVVVFFSLLPNLTPCTMDDRAPEDSLLLIFTGCL